MSEYPIYRKSDLGLTFQPEAMILKVWSPVAKSMRLNLYKSDLGVTQPIEVIDMGKVENGVWQAKLTNDKTGLYYTFQAEHRDGWSDEVPDPYAKAVGRNGKRGQLINPSEANPENWSSDAKPDFSGMKPNDFLVYEVHVRDFSISENSGMENKGKFLAFTERGTKNSKGFSTGVDHLKEMGVTHVHLLPSFDFHTIDETRLDEPQYNWGYDPQNYNVPEGSYSTNPADGAIRIKEFKAMVQSLHEEGIGVVMDVVYNHTSRTDGLSFEELVPGYYYRHWNDSTLGNASGCGNETASEQPMMRKFIIESLKYWANEYHVDGFRFDLMAIHDMETMKEIEKELRITNPNVLLYGEGWTAGDSPLPIEQRALKSHTYQMPGIAAFSDEIRDGLKGHWSSHESKGYVSGNFDLNESVKFGIVGGIEHPQIDYAAVNNTDTAWAAEPHQCMVYVSCHDNHTLYDKLKIANPDASEKEIREMHLLSNFVVLTSQGVPFLHAGVEYLRTKDGVENSYQSPDSINQMDWDEKSLNLYHVEQHQALIKLRKEHPSFRLGSAHEVRGRVVFLDSPAGVLAYRIESPKEDEWKRVVVVINATNALVDWNVPAGDWDLVYPENNVSVNFLKGKLSPRQGYIFAERR
ncbi:type I pullulanase [Cryomorphaceae bacterium 1068]|nr:type I pullulanase [Cryomorphaceae bacterium 1068]